MIVPFPDVRRHAVFKLEPCFRSVPHGVFVPGDSAQIHHQQNAFLVRDPQNGADVIVHHIERKTDRVVPEPLERTVHFAYFVRITGEIDTFIRVEQVNGSAVELIVFPLDPEFPETEPDRERGVEYAAVCTDAFQRTGVKIGILPVPQQRIGPVL